MSHRTRYHKLVVPTSNDPLLVVAALARKFGTEDHVVYEGPQGYAFAVGRLADVAVHRDAVRARHRGGESHEFWASSPYPALQRALDGLPVEEWRAYGTADFELSYAGGELHDTLDDRPLLRLVVPELEVTLHDGVAEIRGIDRHRLHRVADLVLGPMTEPDVETAPVPVEEAGAADYEKAVDHTVRAINEGKLQKVILSRVVPLSWEVDLVATYVEGRRNNTPARSFLLRLDGIEAAGFSPEIVVSVDSSRQVIAQPLAGTRALHPDAEENARVREGLLADSKEIYEHAISVKIAYDELAALSAPTPPVVSDFMVVKERGSVQHLGSEVRAELPPDKGAWDAFATLFPAVTASGIPKDVAYHYIREYEPGDRRLYAGAVLTVGQDGTLDAALVLRTVFRAENRTWLRAGAGIVAQSTAERELEETSEKLRSIAVHAVPGPAPAPALTAFSRAEMRRDVADLLGAAPEEMADDENLIMLGLSSLEVMTLASRWSSSGVVVRYTDLLEQPTISHWSSLMEDLAARP
ncbi:salicylate synthase [Streptomyces umbrinus]